MKKYAIELNDSLKEMTGWPQKVIDMQKNWIGIIDGVNNSFKFNHFKISFYYYTYFFQYKLVISIIKDSTPDSIPIFPILISFSTSQHLYTNFLRLLLE